ncbi:MAG: hypothetical protein LBK13_08225 [Spirochaetales bacterium]|jgi:hypothetical protein|nr:hypothetical protein [Spirochaetales bacterium]
MANKKNYTGLLILVLVILMGGGLVSCISISKVEETETSKTLLAAASEIFAAENNGMALDQFKAAYELKFTGLEFGEQLETFGSGDMYLDFLYEGRDYRLTLVPGEHGYVSARRCVEKIN